MSMTRSITLLVCLLTVSTVWAGEASVYVVHGIPGQDLGLDPPLPVDLLVNDNMCLLQGVTFGEIVGPIQIPTGSYDFAISLTDVDDPCSGDAVIEAVAVPFAEDENATIIAHLAADSTPIASKYTNDFSPVDPGYGRVIAHHTAAAPPLDIVITPFSSLSQRVTIEDVVNNDQETLELAAGSYTGGAFLAGTNIGVVGPRTVGLRPFGVNLVYLVGSLDTGSLRILGLSGFTRGIFVSVGGGNDDE